MKIERKTKERRRKRKEKKAETGEGDCGAIFSWIPENALGVLTRKTTWAEPSG